MRVRIFYPQVVQQDNDISCFVSIAIENVMNSNSLIISGADFHPPHGLVSIIFS